MPPSTSSSASMALARRNGAASKPAQQVIEIDDSSDDEVPAPLHVPRLPTTIGARSRTTVTNSASGSSGNATASVVVRRAALSSTVNSRRASQTFVDHSATEGTSDDADTRPEGHRSAKQSARNSRPTLDAHSNNGEGSSSGALAAPRHRVAPMSATAGVSRKSKRKEREPSTSATEDSSADEAPLVASSARRVTRPAPNEINNSNRRSLASHPQGSSSNSSSSGIDPQRDLTRNSRRVVPDPSMATTSESESESSAPSVASTARATTIRARTKVRAVKSATEPEVTVVTTRRARNGGSGSTAGPSAASTRTRALRGSSISGASTSNTNHSTSEIAPVPSRAPSKGKGRALRSSAEPVNNRKTSRRTFEHTSPRIVKGESYTSFIEDLQDNTAVSPGFSILGSITKTNNGATSRIATKIVIKPTDMSEELECAICSEIMVSPVNLVCGHTFCDACVGPWLDTNKDCPTCRTKMDTKPVRSYFADRIIKKYLEAVYASLEAEGKYQEAKTARQDRAQAEKEAEQARLKAAAEKNRRDAAAAAVMAAAAAARGVQAGMPGAPPPWRFGPIGHNPAAVGAPLPGGRGGGGGRGGRGARARLDAAAIAAENAALAHLPPPAAANNAGQFGNLLQQRGGALHVDPAALQQTANEMGVPAHQLFHMMFQG